MVNIDWKKIMAVMPEKMSDEQKEDWYDIVAWYNPDYNVDKKYLIHLVRVTQEVLKHKAEMMESLVNELDDIAAKQGEEEAHKRQELLDEIDELREQLRFYQKLDRDSGNDMTLEECRSEVVKLEMQNEELVFELQEREKELIKEKADAEALASQMASLEREKLELGRELTALQEETSEKLNARALRDSPEYTPEKLEELTEIVRLKNKHISQLLDDVETVEKENVSLRAKLGNVRDELSETTTHMNDMTAEMSRLKNRIKDFEEKVDDLKHQNKGLLSQIEDLINQKETHDKELDEFAENLNSKIEEWKNILDLKDAEIAKTKEELLKIMNISNIQIVPDVGESELQQTVAKQEEQITVLQKELEKATEELNNSAGIIERLKENKLKFRSSVVDLSDSQTARLQENIDLLESRLKDAEEDALVKAEEMSELVVQLREFESGEYGLADAQKKIRNLDKKIQSKNLQIEKLIDSCNHLEIDSESLAEQNIILREKLGIPESEVIDTSQVKLKSKRDLEMINNLKIQLERKEEDVLKVKLKNRKLVKLLKSSSQVSDLENSQDSEESERKEKKEKKGNGKLVERYKEQYSDLEQKLNSVIKENEALRKGMHEILESIQTQDGNATVEVQSHSLERLLEALDSRHVSGWYHPAMRLQSQLSSAEGRMQELRTQVKCLREGNAAMSGELQAAQQKVQGLEHIVVLQQSEIESVAPKSKSSEGCEDMEESKHESMTNFVNEQRVIELEVELQQLRLLYDKSKLEFQKMEAIFLKEKEDLLAQITGLELKVVNLTKDSDLNETGLKVLELESEAVVLNRKVNFLRDLEQKVSARNEDLRFEMIEVEEELLKGMTKLQKDKSAMLLRLDKLERKLLETVPKENFDTLTKELINAKTKYHQVVNQSLTSYDEGIIEKLQNEIELYEAEKQNILDELRVAKEKLFAAESMVNSYGGNLVTQDAFSNEISVLSGKLATSEVREVNEKQKSNHLEKMNLIIKSQQQELETHNKELMKCVADLTEMNSNLQERERELQDSLGKYSSLDDYNVLLEKLAALEEKYREMHVEKENVQELLDISQGQCRSLQGMRDINRIKSTAVSEQMLFLQSATNDKAIIARLSHELVTAQLVSSELSKKMTDLQTELAKLMTHASFLETKMDERNRELFDVKTKHASQTRYLQNVITDVRTLYCGVTTFPFIENLYNLKVQLRQEQNEIRSKLGEVKVKVQDYLVKREEMEVQLESLEDLKTALRTGDSKNLVTWHNKTTELKLRETRYRRQNEFLLLEISQLEQCVKKLNEEVMALEERGFEKDKVWEQKQLMWEESQLRLLQEQGKRKTSEPLIVEDIEEKETKRETEKKLEKVTEVSAKPSGQIDIEHFLKVIKDQAETMNRHQMRVNQLESDNADLRRKIEEKELCISMKEKMINSTSLKTLELEETVTRDKADEAERTALKVTVESLQKVIVQKEETIYRYQHLLKEGRDEYSKASEKLKDELHSLHDRLSTQGKLYNRLRNSLSLVSQPKDITTSALEKALTKIGELEDEVSDVQSSLLDFQGQARAAELEAERWHSVADDRLSLMEEMRGRLEVQFKSEIEKYKEEIQNYQAELEELGGGGGKERDGREGRGEGLADVVRELQLKLHQYESKNKLQDEWDEAEKERKSLKELESVKRQLKSSKDEGSRLREQLKLLQVQKSKRPGTGSSSEGKSSLKEENLRTKVKTLEELLQIAKDREKEVTEGCQRRIKSAEEVARWEERKRSQQAVDKMAARLKEKEVEAEVLKSKNESFRNMIHRCERERKALESQLRNTKGTDVGDPRMDALLSENARLETEVTSLTFEVKEMKGGSQARSVMILREKLETQERKLAVLELASQGQSPVVEELERLKTITVSQEKANLKLESENLSLQLKLEKTKSELRNALERKAQLEALSVLQDQAASEKLAEDHRRHRQSRDAPGDRSTRRELTRLKEEVLSSQGRELAAIERTRALEEELATCRCQIQLLEEKDLAESISKANNLQELSELSQELQRVKAQLSHKTHLLERVKVLLKKAAAKEKALNDQVSVLQRMVPPGALSHMGTL